MSNQVDTLDDPQGALAHAESLTASGKQVDNFSLTLKDGTIIAGWTKLPSSDPATIGYYRFVTPADRILLDKGFATTGNLLATDGKEIMEYSGVSPDYRAKSSPVQVQGIDLADDGRNATTNTANPPSEELEKQREATE